MKLNARRIRGIVRKELREYRRTRWAISSMAILPLVFTIQPLIAVLRYDASASAVLRHEHVLLYMLGIPTLVPVVLAAFAVAGERQQGTLEPALTTPVRREEFLLAKALSAFVPSVVVAYAVFALFVVVVEVVAKPSVSSAVIQGPDLLAQAVFTPLLAAWSIWVGIGVSTRMSDVRAAQQVGLLASLPPVFVIVLIALQVIPLSVELAVGCAALLLVADGLGWVVVSQLFDREKLITGAR